MNYKVTETVVESGTAKLHVLSAGAADAPAILMLHSLSGNAAIFHGLLNHGLSKQFRVIIPDLRGRGKSSKEPYGYSLETQAADMLAVLDHFGVEQAIVCGHSFGGYLAASMAVWHPERVARVVLLDLATRLNPATPQLVAMPILRLCRVFGSWDMYLKFFQSSPFIDKWDPDMEAFLRRDVEELEDGWIVPRSSLHSALQAATHLMSISHKEWRDRFSAIECPLLLLQATEPFMYGQHIVEDRAVHESLALLRSGQHKLIPGNHISMLFGEGADTIDAAFRAFCLPHRAPARKRRFQLV